jgi:hypothetical protein
VPRRNRQHGAGRGGETDSGTPALVARLPCFGPAPNVAQAMTTSSRRRSPEITAPQDVIPRDAARFRRTLVRVMAVQVVTLVLLWLLQRHYGG